MSSMEDSLRRSLEAGDAGDPAFRESIYAASERALERMFAQRGTAGADADAQRHRLADSIGRLESEYAARYPEPAEGPAPFADDELPAPDGVDPRDPRAFDAGAAASDPRDDEAAHDSEWSPGSDRGATTLPPAGIRPIATTVGLALVFALVLAVLAYVIFSTLRGGSDETVDAAAVESTAAGGALRWIDVFDGNDLETLATPNGGRIETVAGSGGREAVRVSGPQGGEGEVLLSIGPGVVGDIAGRLVRIELTAGSADQTPREFSVRCVFGAASVCDRQRFSTSMGEEAFVFDVAVPADVASPGSIAIGPGLNGTSNDVDIYSVRIRDLS